MRKYLYLVLSIVVVVFVATASNIWWYRTPTAQYQTQEETKNIFVRFDMEVFDTITREYWQKASEGELAELYRLALGKAGGSEHVLPSKDRAGVATILAQDFEGKDEKTQRDAALQVAAVVLYNLQPIGRNSILTSQQEKDFRNTVANINPNTNLYASLDLPQGANMDQVQSAYEEKKKVLAAATSSEEKAELAIVEHAHEVLTNDTGKQLYDQTKMEPSISMRQSGAHTLYVDMSKVTSASFAEFVANLQKEAKKPALTSMIIDLRGNIGGSLDFLQYFLALFVGPNQYAFDFYRKDEFQPQRTAQVPKLNELSRFAEVAVLADAMTQSTAELTIATLKRYRLAYVVGTATRGWGSVENTYPLKTQISEDKQYTLLLVNALTLDENNRPIEGRGVAPDVNVGEKSWRSNLPRYFRSDDIIDAIIRETARKPGT